MAGIKERLQEIKNTLVPYGAELVAVSKFRPLDQLQQVLDAGHFSLGENRVQEMVEKQQSLSKEVCWHQIGTLQRNKVKYIAPFVHLIHSVESMDLLLEVERQGRKENRLIPFLFQMHIAVEETKFGLSRKELDVILENPLFPKLEFASCQGLMGMATNTQDETQVSNEFKSLKTLYEELKRAGLPMQTLSMGMSQDWKLALDEGSTLVRVGSALFEGDGKIK